ncbi:hypothetical protein [Microbacterium jejuense]|uniref:O-antigen ligase family protein n=1 Tax=Microbacterium jejuense TaxID=1263637 RepID=UPI0031EAB386
MSTIQAPRGPTTTPPTGPAPTAPRHRAPRPRIARQTVAGAIVAVVAVAVVLLLPPLTAGATLLTVALLFLARRLVFSWVGGLAVLVAVIMFVPVRRYALPIPLPFALEPYRVVLIVLLVALVAALALDRTRTWRPVAFGWPIGIFVATLLLSIIANGPGLVAAGLASTAAGALLNFLILLSTFYIARQLLTTERLVLGLVTALVWCGTIVAVLAIFERITRINVFWRLATVLPLKLLADDSETFRAGGFRSYGSAQHPIALSVMLAMLIPLAIYLAQYARRPHNDLSRRLLYGGAVAVLLVGVLTAVSRTAVVVLGVMLLLALLLRPWLGVTLIALSLPAFVLGFLLVPKMFDTLFASFLDIDSLIASQETSPGMTGAGRLADLGPAMQQVVASPFFGTGMGSRIVVGDEANAFILDNQVLGTLMESGAVGVAGLAVFLLTPVVMLVRWAFITARDEPRYALLAFAVTAAIVGYTAALFFYDAFGFYQTFFVLCLLLAVGAWLLTESPPAVAARAARAAPAEVAR